MSLEATLRTRVTTDSAVSAISGTRMYPWHRVPQGVTRPFLSYFRVGGTQETHLDSTTADTITNIQIDCWADDYTTSLALADAVRARLNAWRDRTKTPPIDHCILESEQDLPVSELAGQSQGTCRRSLDFSIRHD